MILVFGPTSFVILLLLCIINQYDLCMCVCVSVELLNHGGCEVCVCAEVEELRSQVSRLQSRNRELELQSSGRNNDHSRQIRQVTQTHTRPRLTCK